MRRAPNRPQFDSLRPGTLLGLSRRAAIRRYAGGGPEFSVGQTTAAEWLASPATDPGRPAVRIETTTHTRDLCTPGADATDPYDPLYRAALGGDS